MCVRGERDRRVGREREGRERERERTRSSMDDQLKKKPMYTIIQKTHHTRQCSYTNTVVN